MAKGVIHTRKRTTEPPPVDLLIKPAICLGLVLLAYQFIKGIRSEIPRINVLDESELREAFFGEGDTGKSYAILCHKEDSKKPISSVFSEAFNQKSSPAEFRLIDCDHTLLSSGKTIWERFQLDPKQRPTIFLSGAVGPPVQIPSQHLRTGAMLSKVLRGKLEARTVKIETTQDLRSKCLDKDMCAILLKGSKTSPVYLKDAVSKLIKEYPNVVFASVDSTSLYLLNMEEHMVELTHEQPRFAVLKKISGALATGSDRLILSMADLSTNYGDRFGYGPMSNLIASVVNGSAEMIRLTSLPVIKTRTKKLEESERSKRERKLNQQQRHNENAHQQSASGSNPFHANDGSREGRKAERERRRAEHYRDHNIREKTPEEIAEIERQRRARMTEEAAKWNIATEDALDERELYEEIDENVLSEDVYNPSIAFEGSEREDVLDLD